MSSSREFNGQGILPLCSMRIRNFFGGNTNKVSCTLSTVITVFSLKEIRHEHTPFDTLLSGDFRIYVSRNLYHNIFNFQCPNLERVTQLKALQYMQCMPLCPSNTGGWWAGRRKLTRCWLFWVQNAGETKHDLTSAEPGRNVIIKVGTLKSRHESTILHNDRATCAALIARNLEDCWVYTPDMSDVKITARTQRKYRGSLNRFQLRK